MRTTDWFDLSCVTAGVWCYLDCLVFDQKACLEGNSYYRCSSRLGSGIFECLCFISPCGRCLGDYVCACFQCIVYSAYGHGWWRYDCVNTYQVPQALDLCSEWLLTAEQMLISMLKSSKRGRVTGTGFRFRLKGAGCLLSFINSSPVYVNHHCSLNREQHEGANSFDQHPVSLCFSLDYAHK